MMEDREWTNMRDTILPKQGVTGISQITMDTCYRARHALLHSLNSPKSDNFQQLYVEGFANVQECHTDSSFFI
ncbi:hypothetical protein RvY_17427 [Ramazzottius varieornatus]|uniref:Uncharacterized protein n=1 Tax=Ramazzottius varieornatus TaxID=947166 RepID=A0A1D1W2H8_RAMVA|nr:hypothetical protein RvY_17427 [Ramazzottius varieornatus]